MGMPYPDDGGSYEQVPLRGVTRARALILPHSFACYCFSIPKPAMCRRENVSLTWLIYNMLKNFPTESFFQKFFIFFSFSSRRAYARQIIDGRETAVNLRLSVGSEITIHVSKYHTPKGMWLVIPTGVDISNQHSSQGWAYRWHCGSSAFRPDAISAPTTVPGNPSGSPRLRDT